VAARSLIPRLTDIIEAIERILSVLGDILLDVLRPIGNGSVARRAPRRDYFRGEPPPYGGPEGPSSRNSLAESGWHRQRAAPQLRKHRCAHHMEASAGRFAASRKSQRSWPANSAVDRCHTCPRKRFYFIGMWMDCVAVGSTRLQKRIRQADDTPKCHL
jgi:hypothetical protein